MEYKNLFRKIERTLRRIERSADMVSTVYEILRRLVDDFQDDLGLLGGRIYVLEGDDYVLERAYPARRAPIGFRIPASYPPVQELRAQGFVYRRLHDPGVSAEIERQLGVERFAAIAIGERSEQIVAFTLRRESDPDQVVHTLNTIRLAINLKLRADYYSDRVGQAREIQMSLLPKTAPVFGDFDIWGTTRPAEEVGGDLYDFIPISARNLGVAVADASGHGLPAALQARDAIIGLRMGVEERLRISATLEKLNKVVNHSALASKFISLFYGEIEPTGTVVYCNAGHPAPLLWDGKAFSELGRGGMLLGPNRDATYERGYAQIAPGSVLVAYTDGITEAWNRRGEAFGVERLKRLLRRQPWASAREVVDAAFDAVDRFASGSPQEDDQTVVAVLRRPSAS